MYKSTMSYGIICQLWKELWFRPCFPLMVIETGYCDRTESYYLTIKQTYFRELKYFKNYLISNPQNLYEQTPTTEREPSPNIIPKPSNDTQFPQNVIAQKHSFTLLQNSKTELYEYNKLLYMTTSSEFRTQFTSKIRKLEEIIMFEENKLKKLKGTKEVQLYHHPAQIRLAAVKRNETNEHIDEHYCLALVKGVKSFASAFSQDVVLISQNDKAKVIIRFH
ncbi:hypothetical protein RhiirB3_384800 [Rhizophagus irregularis]|nr:hypothetical protein RhiirB3_384800 [Rhizophagus irregularis]